MKNNKDFITSAFTFGILLLVLGIIGRFLNWQQANTLFIMGVLFEIAALLLSLYDRKNNKDDY